MKKYDFTDEEVNALRYYKDVQYEAINQLLVSNCETDIALLSDEVENTVVPISYDRENVQKNMEIIKIIYEMMQKIHHKNDKKAEWSFVRGTNIAEIEDLKNELYIDKFLSTTSNFKKAANEYSAIWNRPAVMYIYGNENIPYLDVDKVFGRGNTSEIIISPFTRITQIAEADEIHLNNVSKPIRAYNVAIEKQELEELSEQERTGLFHYILDNANSVNRRLNECIALEKENSINYENMRKLEQLLAKYNIHDDDREYSESERAAALDDIERITRELNELKLISSEMYQIRKSHIDFVTNWKKNIAVYLMSECREIELKYEKLNEAKEENKEQVVEKEEVTEEKIELEATPVIVPEIEVVNEEATVASEETIEPVETIEEIETAETVEIKEQQPEIVEEALEEKIEEIKEDVIEEEPVLDNQETIRIDTNVINSVLNSKVVEENKEEIIENNSQENIEEVKEEVSVENNESIVEEYPQEEKVEVIKPNLELEDAKTYSEVFYVVNKESEENIEMVEKLIKNIEVLISKQQNYAKIAGNLGTNYSALSNGFEMKKVAENLLVLVQTIDSKVKEIDQKEDKEQAENVESLKEISGVNIQISTLINYLNNPKIATKATKINRFDEICIIEENELKRGIATRIREICGEAELKKLKDDTELLEDKTGFSRFVGIFTGQNRLDEFMLEQIEIRKNAIRRTLSKKMTLTQSYSIHELIAGIRMFIEENNDDELVDDFVGDLQELEAELKRNFIIIDSKVKDIVDRKEGRNLPVTDKKISRMELIEIETFQFLHKYGYDIVKNEVEPEYKNTVASELSRIIEYINTSKILEK